ncbi:tocopherol cyclase family protein [Alkalibacterium sp.]|nr:MAG: hypothetical protein EA249_03530 [Alkalibacterium sp.]
MNRFNFQGEHIREQYFEGWYVKTIDSNNDLSIALIPGVAHFSENESFVQYNINYKGQSYSGKITFPREHFSIVGDPQTIALPKFVLNERGVMGSLSDSGNRIVFDLDFGVFTPIKETVYSPSIMGPFEYLKMPCSHDVISMKHSVTGTVFVNGEKVVIENGSGYIEKDRGSTFPSKYVWAQANNFSENNKASLFLSVAQIEKSALDFIGTIAVFHDGIEEHRFATYLGTRVNVEVDYQKNQYTVTLRNPRKKLEVWVRLANEMSLIAPMKNEMDYAIKETVKSDITLKFSNADLEAVHLTTENGAAELVNW